MIRVQSDPPLSRLRNVELWLRVFMVTTLEAASARRSIAVVLVLSCALVTGCASYSPPKPVASPDYLLRLESKIDGDVQVSAAVLSAEESEQVFATGLARKGIQPIWLEIENREDQEFVLMLNSVEPLLTGRGLFC